MSIIPFNDGVFSFVTTNGCTAKCSHCLMNCKPGLKHKLNFEQMRKAIDQFTRKKNAHLVVFTGGESTLLGEDLLRAIRYATLKFLKTRLVTNAHWASSLERAQNYVKKLREVGLTEIDFSVDDYHEPFVPLDNIRNAWLASKGVGFDSVTLANSFGPKDKINPDFIREYLGEDLPEVSSTSSPDSVDLKRSEDGTFYNIHTSTLQKSGRAEDLDSEQFIGVENQELLDCACKWVVVEPVLSPLGHMWACCGIPADNIPILDLGDANKERIDTILKRASKDVLINALYYLGPYKLCKFVEEHSDIRFKRNFGGACEICSVLTGNKKAVEVLRANEKSLAAVVQAVRFLKEKGIPTGLLNKNTR
ncbi:MAG: radical SAM protein [Fibrobacter sp.]|uniref:radical SAM protein n=1 Tax=Fibrobacter sp. TaxID=35828 RepID=UPI0015651860|nr:radical SAM protein [Fibrobacter sp.]MBR4786181.1 radical SAM protein [Fibrobacter sp.]